MMIRMMNQLIMVVFVDDGVDYAGDIVVSDSGEKLREKFKKNMRNIFLGNFCRPL